MQIGICWISGDHCSLDAVATSFDRKGDRVALLRGLVEDRSHRDAKLSAAFAQPHAKEVRAMVLAEAIDCELRRGDEGRDTDEGSGLHNRPQASGRG